MIALRVAAIAAIVAGVTLAQFSSHLQGVVLDASGSVIPSASVKLKNLSTGVEQAAKTNEAGVYRFSSLLPALMRSPLRRRVSVAFCEDKPVDGPDCGLNLTLKVAGTSERVQVVAEAPPLDTSDMRLQTTIQTEKLESLPLFGRNFMALAAVAPGVTGYGLVSGGSSGNTMDNFAIEKFVDASGNGRNYSGNLMTMDGLNVTSNIIQGVANLSPNPDSVQELAVQTNTFSVEQGKASSIQVAITTKSGTNEFHGTGSYFFNNQDLQARTIFTSAYAPFRKHMVAGTLEDRWSETRPSSSLPRRPCARR